MLDSTIFKSGGQVRKGSKIAKQEKNDCVVRAIANAFEINYDDAHAWVKKELGRKNKKGTKNTSTKLRKGFDGKVVTFTKTGQLDLFNGNEISKKVIYIGSNPKKGGKLRNKKYTHKEVAFTIKTFLSNFTTGTYLVFVDQHALVIKNGVLIDNLDKRFSGYRRVVESAFKIC